MDMSLSVDVNRRKAKARINSYWAKYLDLPVGVADCCTIGIPLQVAEDANCAYPVFVCEFANGRCAPICVDRITFVDTVHEEDYTDDN